MSIQPNLSITNSIAQEHRYTDSHIVLNGGEQKARLNLLMSDATDLRFNIACEPEKNSNFFKKFLFRYTHVKMTVNGEAIYINKNSAANRLGLTIEQVEQVAATNDLTKFQKMAERRKEIYDFIDKYHKSDLDYSNETHKMYYVWMRYTPGIMKYTSSTRRDGDIYTYCDSLYPTYLKALSQYEFIKMDNFDGTKKLFKVDGFTFGVAKFDKPEKIDPSKPLISVTSNIALINLYSSFVSISQDNDDSVENAKKFSIIDDKITNLKMFKGDPTTFYEWTFALSEDETGPESSFSKNKP